MNSPRSPRDAALQQMYGRNESREPNCCGAAMLFNVSTGLAISFASVCTGAMGSIIFPALQSLKDAGFSLAIDHLYAAFACGIASIVAGIVSLLLVSVQKYASVVVVSVVGLILAGVTFIWLLPIKTSIDLGVFGSHGAEFAPKFDWFNGMMIGAMLTFLLSALITATQTTKKEMLPVLVNTFAFALSASSAGGMTWKVFGAKVDGTDRTMHELAQDPDLSRYGLPAWLQIQTGLKADVKLDYLYAAVALAVVAAVLALHALLLGCCRRFWICAVLDLLAFVCGAIAFIWFMPVKSSFTYDQYSATHEATADFAWYNGLMIGALLAFLAGARSGFRLAKKQAAFLAANPP